MTHVQLPSDDFVDFNYQLSCYNKYLCSLLSLFSSVNRIWNPVRVSECNFILNWCNWHWLCINSYQLLIQPSNIEFNYSLSKIIATTQNDSHEALFLSAFMPWWLLCFGINKFPFLCFNVKFCFNHRSFDSIALGSNFLTKALRQWEKS